MKNKRQLKELSVEEFLAEGLSGSDTSDSEPSDAEQNISPKKVQLSVTKQIPNGKDLKSKKGKAKPDADAMPANKTGSIAKHKASLEKLKEQDPEFYEFLKEEDQKLLNFNADEDEDDEDDNGEEESSSEMEEESEKEESSMEEEIDSTDSEEEERLKKASKSGKFRAEKDDFLSDSDVDSEEGGLHKLPDKLEMATDSEEDEEDEEETGTKQSATKSKRDIRQIVTMKMINEWTVLLRETSPTALKQVVQAFRAAVQRAGSDAVFKSVYKVEGGTIFNAIVRMCVRELPVMLNRLIKLPKPKDPNRPILPLHSPQWKPIRKDMICYLTDLIQLVNQLAEPKILNVILKHVTQMIPYYACNPKLTKAMLRSLDAALVSMLDKSQGKGIVGLNTMGPARFSKPLMHHFQKLISLWSVGEETSRVLAFLSLIRLTRLRQETFLEFVLKQMYMSYVKNCKFTSPTTLPMINFMQCSMVEIFAIDHVLTYQYAFVYIRQLAIHLRNAITVKKKDHCQAVYNWQYIHSLQLWSRTLGQLYPSDVLQPLIYPLVQTVIGTIKLIPTTRYFPLRFHCVQALNTLSRNTKTFIPVLPFLFEIFDLTDFNKKHQNISIKPLNFSCMLKLSKAQLRERSFRDGVIDQIYELMMEALHIHAHTIGFPELVVPAMIQMKKFVKTCKVANYTKQIKQIIDKVEETSKVITRRRQSAALRLSDSRAVEHWERKSAEEGTPLGKYYATWRKLRDRELQVEVSGKDRISHDDLPVIKRLPKEEKKIAAKKREFTGLFDSDSDEDEDDTDRFLPKEQRPNKKQKTCDNDESDYSDFDENDLERLAQSASEDEDDDDAEDIEDDDDDDDDEEEEEAEVDDDSDASEQEDIVEDLEFSSDDD